MPRRRWHRGLFLTAGVYNLCWGFWSAIDSQWLFRFTGMAPANHPEIFACLGMVVGLYGLLYFEVVRSPERGWMIAAVGLLGKLLGVIAAIALIRRNIWPPSALIVPLTNDVIWLAPFVLYLRDAWPPPFWRSFVDWADEELEGKPDRHRVVAFEFDSDRSLAELRATFHQAGSTTWMERDSEWHGEYISSVLKEGCMAKLYERTGEPGPRYVIQYKLEPFSEVRESDLLPILVNLLLPAGVRDVKPAEPYD